MNKSLLRFDSSTVLPILLISGLVGITLLLLSTPYYAYAIWPTLGLIGLLWLCTHFEYALYAIIFLIPFGAFRKFSVGSLEINLPWVLAAFLLITLALQWAIEKRNFKSLQSHLWPWLFLLLLISALSTAQSRFYDTAVQDVKLWISAFIFIATALMVLKDSDLLHKIPIILISSVSLSAFLGTLGFFFELPLFIREQENGEFARSLGGAIDANNMSLMVIACLPLLVHHLLFAEKNSLRWLFFLLILNSLIAIGTSYSRGGFLILIIASLLMLWEFRRFNRARNLGFALLLLTSGVLTFVQIMPDSFWERQKSLASWDDSSLTRRTSYLFVAQDSFVENPFLGTGPGTFRDVFSESEYARVDKDTGESQPRYAHNTYVEILVGTGLFGLLLFLTAIFLTIRGFTQAKRHFEFTHQPKQAALMVAYRLFFINIMVYLLIFSEPFHKFMLLAFALSSLALRFSLQHLQEFQRVRITE